MHEVSDTCMQGRRNDFKSVWARPEKADEWGGGGGGTPTHFFFFWTSNLYLIQVGGSPPTWKPDLCGDKQKKKKKRTQEVGGPHGPHGSAASACMW